MKHPLLFASALALAACAAENKNEQALPAQAEQTKLVATADAPTYISRLDSVEIKRLSDLVKLEHELNTFLARNDTVTLVLANRALFFPLGRYTSISALQYAYSAGYTHQVREAGEDGGSVIDNMRKGGNAIELIRIEEDPEAYEDKVFFIVSGEITDGSLPLANVITVGMDKRAFLGKYFSSVPPLLIQGGKVIVLESALSGIRHYYRFNEQKLASIEFASNYVVD